MTSAIPSVALPGQVLAPAAKYTPGNGTHLHESQICASIAGIVVQATQSQMNGTANSSKLSSNTSLPTLSVLRSRPSAAAPTSSTSPSQTSSTPLPLVSSTVLARITRLTPRQAHTQILSIDNIPCPTPYGALIRQQDIRATQKDSVKVLESFRVGDIVRAVVISLGDGQNYYLSTAENRLGVLVARGEQSGGLMQPVSWREMVDPVTGAREMRKVGRPD